MGTSYNSVWTNIVKTGNYIDNHEIDFGNSFIRQVGNGKSTSFWHDSWLGNFTLKNRFQRLFRLERRPNSTVFERMVQQGGEWVLNWDWIRDPASRASGELDDLNLMLQGIKLTEQKDDSWAWFHASNGAFKTKILNTLIDEKTLYMPQSVSCTIRNKLVPKKVEVFIWRVRKGRIPVLLELEKRGADFHLVRCPICDNGTKSCQHSLLSCELSDQIWQKIFEWWNIRWQPNTCIGEILEEKSGNTLGNKIWQAVTWTCAYLIWKNRNEKVFKNKCWNIPVAISEIQVKSFEWIEKRCTMRKLNWHDWLHNPHIYLV
ncbi:uncharacterized protein [Rutidosis leptorrhynchoides]|uniref:uncharacterized protein n=1 Tax=Rutidosis leptorrhynchoides TaxID=125765 RepID=UPI003A9995DB